MSRHGTLVARPSLIVLTGVPNLVSNGRFNYSVGVGAAWFDINLDEFGVWRIQFPLPRGWR